VGKGHVFRSIVATAVICGAWSGCGRSGIWGEPDASASDVARDSADAAVDVDALLDAVDERDVVTWPPNDFTTVWGSSPTDVYVMGQGIPSKIRFDGEAWNFIDDHLIDPRSNFPDVWIWDIGGSSANDVLAVGVGPTLPMLPTPPIEYAWQFAGDHWSWSIEVDPHDASDPLGVILELRGIWSLSSSSAWVAGVSDGGVAGIFGLILHYDGSRWTRREHGRLPPLESIWGTSDDEVFAVGHEGTIIRLVDGEWEEMESPVETDLLGVWGQSARDIYAVGEAGIILHYNGTAWSLMESGTEARLNSVWGDVTGDVFAVGIEGTILAFHGETWVAMDSDTEADLLDVWGSSSTYIYAVGLAWYYDPLTGSIGVIVHFDGVSWQRVEDLPEYSWP
jgi:hypothetical protein